MIASNNAYFTTNDMTVKSLNGKMLPREWWSRPYEYAFALRFTGEKAVVADMGCGWMGRPLTAELARQCKEVYGIDADAKVLEIEKEESNLYYLSMDFATSEMQYFRAGSFDTIFCISVIEDLSPDDRLYALKNFERLIARRGKIIITMDTAWESFRAAEPYPTVNLKRFIREVKAAGLRFVGKVKTDMPLNAVHHARWNLSCYHCVLERDKND